MTNGDLIRLAEQAGFELLITTDTNLRYQKNLQGCSLTILVLTTNNWLRIRQATEWIVAVINGIETGSYRELMIP